MSRTLHEEARRAVDGSASTLDSERLKLLLELHRGWLSRETGTSMDEALGDLFRALDADRAAVFLRNPSGAFDVLVASPKDQSDARAYSQTVVERVFETREALLATDIDDGSDLGAAESIQKFKIRSVLAVPLSAGDLRGVLYLDSRSERRRFTAGDLEFAAAAAFYLGSLWSRADDVARLSRELTQSNERLALLEGDLRRYQIVGRAPVLLQAFDEVKRFAKAGLRVLLRGETGTGKELFARAYAAESDRATKAFVPVNIPALSPTIVESELFGHIRGAFTEAVRDKPGRLELADGGVLFLDEVGEIDPSVQAKLLRFLDSGETFRVGETRGHKVDVRVVSATNRAIETSARGQADSSNFRADLFARLGQVVRLPALRERASDIPQLAEYFLKRTGATARTFSPEALDAMSRYRWPLNVRELRHVVERAVALSDADQIKLEDLPVEVRLGDENPTPEDRGTVTRTLKSVVQDAEREHFVRVLAHTQGQRRKAIAILGISPETFYKRLAEYGLETE